MSAGTISINPGEDFTLDLAVTNVDGSAYNLTGCTLRLRARKNATTDPVIDKSVTAHTNPTAGLSAIALSPTDTALAIRSWQFILTLTDALGHLNQSNTGNLVVTNGSPTTGTVTVSLGASGGSVNLTIVGGGSSAVSTVAGRTGDVVLVKADVGLGNVDNTSDVNKPVSTAQAAADASKQPLITAGTTAQYYRGDKSFQTLNQDAVPSGTTNKAYTATEQTKLAGVASGATANSPDATLLNRANHMGSQAESTVTNLVTDLSAITTNVATNTTAITNKPSKGFAIAMSVAL